MNAANQAINIATTTLTAKITPEPRSQRAKSSVDHTAKKHAFRD
jgi:hypothetical protein